MNNTSNTVLRLLRSGPAVAALAMGWLAAPALAAQEANAPSQDQAQSTTEEAAGEQGGEIVVTGSRVTSNGFNAPTPVTIVSGEALLQQTPSTIGEALNKLPQFANSIRPSTSQFAPESGAATSLNLRSLGAQRGLVLLDGRRINASTASGTVDISLLPEELVRNVEIVTGGASAAYGSDAVAGVVNFVLDTGFMGIKAAAQAGITDRGDNPNAKVSLTAGMPITDAIHLVASGSFYHSDGVADYRKRDWFQSCAAILNPAGPPARLQVCNARSPYLTEGGLITSGPLAGTQFLDGGVPAPFQYGTLLTPTMMVGGGNDYDEGIDMQPLAAVRRATAFAHLKIEASPDLSFFVEGLYGYSNAVYKGTLQGFYGATPMTIYADNAFLPSTTRTAMANLGLSSFSMSENFGAVGPFINDGTSRTKRVTTGFHARTGGWNVDGYYEFGTNLQTIRARGNLTLAHAFDAIDSVVNPANGQIVCRTTLADPGHPCVPFNPFGANSASPESVAFLRSGPGGDGSTTWERTKQHVAEVVVRGSPFSTWAGDVALAFGAGYRKETVDRKVDPGSNGPKISCLQADPTCANPYPIPRGVPSSYLARPIGAYMFSNQSPITGGYDLWEVFGEVAVPLVKDASWTRELSVNLAARYTDYSTSGGVTTWKAGLNWQPIDDVRFRVTRSRDIRAPNLTELYSSSSAGAGAVTDPTRGNASSVVVNLAGGNLDLVPEEADTFTGGAVFSPGFLPGFQLSADYYSIKIGDAIGQLGTQNIVNQCAAGSTALCSRIERDTNGVIFRVNNAFLNINQMKTRGIDFEASYRTSLGEGSLGFRALASRVFELSTLVPGAAVVDRAGQVGLSGGVPSWNFNFDLNYQRGPFSLSVNERVIGAGSYDATYVEGRDIDNNHIPAVAYTDLSMTYRFDLGGHSMELFGTVNNLLDQAPPRHSGYFFVFMTVPTNTYLYDQIGRAYTGGLRFRF